MKKKAVRHAAKFLTALLLIFTILPMGAAFANEGGAAEERDGLKMFKLEGDKLKDGTFKDPDGPLEVTLTFTAAGKIFGWKSNIPVHDVYVKAGTEGLTYTGGFVGAGLTAPEDKDISHIAFYYKVEGGNGDDNGGGKGNDNNPGNGNDNGGDKDSNAKKNKFKVNLIKGCNPFADKTFFILKDNTRVDLSQGMNKLDIELDDIAKVGVVLKTGKELTFNKDEVVVESPKNENGTIIFKIECKEKGGAAVKLVVKNCIGTFEQAWLVLKDGKQVEFTALGNLILFLDENPNDIVGIKLKAGDKTTDYLLTDAKVTKETINGSIIIKIHCEEKPPVEKPEITKVKLTVKGCIGLVDKAWLVLADNKEVEFTSLGKMLLQLEGTVGLDGIKGVKLKVGDQTATYLLTDANVTEEKVDGTIIINVNCIEKPPVEKPDVTKVKLVVKGCIGSFDKAWLILSNGQEVQFTSLLSLVLNLEGSIKLDNIVGVKLQNGDKTSIYLLSNVNVTEEVKNGNVTIKINCDKEQPPVVPAITKIKLLIEGCIGPVERAVVVLKNGNEIEITSNTLELLVNLGINEIEGFKLTVYGEVKTIKLADLALKLITLKDGTLSVTLDCDLAEGEKAITKIKIDVSTCIGTITKTELILKNGTRIDVLNNTIDLKAALALDMIDRVELTVNGQVKAFKLSDLTNGSKTVVEGLLTLKVECPVAPPADNGGGGGTPPGDNGGGSGGTTPPPAPPVIIIPDNPTPGGPIENAKEIAHIKLEASGCVGIGQKGKIILQNGQSIDFTFGENGTFVDVNLNVDEIKGVEVELNGQVTLMEMKNLQNNKLDGILHLTIKCELTPSPIPADPGTGGGTDPGTGGGTDPITVDPEDPSRGGESDEVIPPVTIGDNETPGGNVGGFDGSLPQTGESSPMPFYFIGMLLAVAGFGMLRASKVRS
ncbi:LPXTG cell wall anchor domain-containing protein [Bacillus sp. FJAT-27445]|uniref:LPXTG cell wall anchor domain-containing protein n=1 Tax=Bacillus sp. FJAT-27445 TaxID=1679166 RepID=UPI0007440985|nr:LPXTG cell wall anchor domain-containing protein [Bacillus sp. FJAT-27445]